MRLSGSNSPNSIAARRQAIGQHLRRNLDIDETVGEVNKGRHGRADDEAKAQHRYDAFVAPFPEARLITFLKP